MTEPKRDELLDAADIMEAMADGHCSMGAVSTDIASKRRRIASWLKELARSRTADPTRMRHETEGVLFRTTDPTVQLQGKPIPAMTSLLHRVCDNDPDKFEEATRIVELFITEALNDTAG
jgi:hypothetical protein